MYPVSKLTVGDIVSTKDHGVFTIDKIIPQARNYIRVVGHRSNGHVFQLVMNTAGSVDVWE